MADDFENPPFGDCADCGATFWLTVGERAFFERSGLPLPKRCAACRQAKREANARRGERPARTAYSASWRPSAREGR